MNIYVGNISFRATEEDLIDLFVQFGDVASAKIITDRETGRSRGFAFVDMDNHDEGLAAIEALNGREHMGRNLTVNEARPRQPRY
ncbi:MAG: RNA-binding protein [Zetaproteobacteria bacterium]|nr:MAG: RNA-binding protein [Zetaproteobacteria bacterium]